MNVQLPSFFAAPDRGWMGCIEAPLKQSKHETGPGDIGRKHTAPRVWSCGGAGQEGFFPGFTVKDG